MKITKIAIFEQFFSMFITGVCDEYGLHFWTWINYLTCPVMSEVKRKAMIRN